MHALRSRRRHLRCLPLHPRLHPRGDGDPAPGSARPSSPRVTWERYTDATITDRACLEEQLEQISARGWAVDDGEFEAFVNCVAVPIASSEGVVGALSVTALRMVKDLEALTEYLPLMKRVAGQIGRSLQ